MVWTEQEIEEIEDSISYEVMQLEKEKSYTRRIEALIVKSIARGFYDKGFDYAKFNNLTVSLNLIQKELIPKAKRDIFLWERINKATLILDTQIKKFEQKKLGRIDKEVKQELKSASEHRKNLKESNKLIVLGKKQEKLIHNLAELHDEIDNLINDIRDLAYKFRSTKSDKVLTQLIKETRNLYELLEKDHDVCSEITKDDYIRLKIIAFLKRNIFKALEYERARGW